MPSTRTRSLLDNLMVTLLAAAILGVFSGAATLWVEVKMLKVEVDRLDVYVDQLWKEKHK